MRDIQSLKELLSIIADAITVITLIWVSFYGLIKKHKNLLGFRINEFIGFILKSSIILIISVGLFRLSTLLYLGILVFVKGNDQNMLWEKGHEFAHSISYFVSATFGLTILWLISTIIWTGSFKYVKNLWDNSKLKDLFNEFMKNKELIIEEAVYKATDENFKNVTLIVQKMIKNNSLTITASNNLAGDPLFGTPKNLIIKYKIGKKGISRTINIPENKTGYINIEGKDSL